MMTLLYKCPGTQIKKMMLQVRKGTVYKNLILPWTILSPRPPLPFYFFPLISFSNPKSFKGYLIKTHVVFDLEQIET